MLCSWMHFKQTRLRGGVPVVGALWLTGACMFPDFKTPTDSAGASGGAAVGASAHGGTNAAEAGTGASSGSTTGGNAGEPAGGAGGSADEEVGPCGPRLHPLHCRNQEQDAGETDVDCGGPSCEPCGADEMCLSDGDCGLAACQGGHCARLFELTYVQLNPDLETTSLRLQVDLAYLGSEPQLLRDVSVRYYFSRNSVAEPLLPGGTSALLPGAGDVSGDTVWNIVRQLRGNGISNDAYLEIGFRGGRVLAAGQTLELVANLTSGTLDTAFNQGTHHSWDVSPTAHESKKLSVHVGDARVWGRGPDVDDAPSCFQQGVNLDGPALTVDGEPWFGSPAAALVRYADATVLLQPATEQGREDMLRTGFLFQDNSFDFPVESGSYALLVYVWSAGGGETGTLTIDGDPRDVFRAQSFNGGGPWVALGPYRVEVEQAALQLGATGTLRVGGFELRLLDE
jgi:hypothetical protein